MRYRNSTACFVLTGLSIVGIVVCLVKGGVWLTNPIAGCIGGAIIFPLMGMAMRSTGD